MGLMLENSGINLKIIEISELKNLSLQQREVGMTNSTKMETIFFLILQTWLETLTTAI